MPIVIYSRADGLRYLQSPRSSPDSGFAATTPPPLRPSPTFCSSPASRSVRPQSGVSAAAPQSPLPDLAVLSAQPLTDTVAIDMFIVAPATFRILYVLIVLDHHRRKIIHFGMTENPTQVWLSHQIAEAFPWDTAPRYRLRDRDASYGPVFHTRAKGMDVEEIVIAPRIRSIRRDCLDHVVIFGEQHLHHLLISYRTHLSLKKDAPIPRDAQRVGRVLALPILGGLHHRYVRV